MELERIKVWLQSWPGWKTGENLYVNYTDSVSGNCGLFPTGTEEVRRKTDVLGNVTVHLRFRFTLYRVTGEEDVQANARWVQQLESWVGQQSIRGLAPTFGDDPQRSFIRAEKGRLCKTRQTGNTMYAVDFTAEYIKFYEVNE